MSRIPPDCAEVVVIGGGVIGVMAALYLRGRASASSCWKRAASRRSKVQRNWGWIRAQGRDSRRMPIMLEAQRMWRELGGTWQGRLGVRTLDAYLAEASAELAGYRAGSTRQRVFGSAAGWLHARWPRRCRGCAGRMAGRLARRPT